MKSKISAKGYTNVILVLNMKRFIDAKDHTRFENIRGTPAFADVLRNGWWNERKIKSAFTRVSDVTQPQQVGSHMSTEQVGFATGIFRSLFLEEHVVPTYLLNKEQVKFAPDLIDNFQFRTLFLRVWKSWKIYVRPTVSGFFVIRLTREYTSPRELIKIAEDVLHLHESLDVQSARLWLAKKKQEYKNQPEELAKVQRSVKAFLKWLGIKNSEKGELLYNPVQWKLAMEVATEFVKATGEIPIPGSEPLHLSKPEPSLSIPLHDSYVIYHVDDIFADESIVIKEEKTKSEKSKSKRDLKNNEPVKQVLVKSEYLRHSPEIKRALINLIEGAILERQKTNDENEEHTKNNANYFPTVRWQNLEHIMENNLASWMGEICLLTSRTALLIPERKYRKDNLLVSTTPGATLKVGYARYWGAIERMIEFCVEIRTLAQLVERASYESLEETAKTVDSTRETLQAGDIELGDHLPQHVKSAGNLRRLAALSQGISDPMVWSRSEYAIIKAQHLLNQLGVPTLLTHIDRNISSLNSLVNHIDELYALDLAEKNNDLSAVMTLGLTAVSFILTIIMLPSFWADLQQIDKNKPELGLFSDNIFLNSFGWAGTAIGLVLILFSLFVGLQSVWYIRKISGVIKRSLKRIEKIKKTENS